jgi:hypothetical protein
VCIRHPRKVIRQDGFNLLERWWIELAQLYFPFPDCACSLQLVGTEGFPNDGFGIATLRAGGGCEERVAE